MSKLRTVCCKMMEKLIGYKKIVIKDRLVMFVTELNFLGSEFKYFYAYFVDKLYIVKRILNCFKRLLTVSLYQTF